MSADNYISVHPQDGKWIVSHGFMSPQMEDCQYRGTELSVHDSRGAALVAAHDRAKEEWVLEYGVIELPELSRELCRRCFACVYERSEVDPDLERCAHCNGPISESETMVGISSGWYHSHCEPGR